MRQPLLALHRLGILLGACGVFLLLAGLTSPQLSGLTGSPPPTPPVAIANSVALAQEISTRSISIVPTPTLARRAYLAAPQVKMAPTSYLPGHGPELAGDLAFSGRFLDIYAGRGSFSCDDVAKLGPKIELALRYIQKRFATQLQRRTSIGIYATGAPPGTRGLAFTDSHTINVFYRAGEDQRRAVIILSHEMGHQLEAEAYGDDAQRRTDTILLEGLATWISGDYWLSLYDAKSFQERARQLVRQGYTTDVTQISYRADSMVTYEIWAGFVDYLTQKYGWDRFNMLYASGGGRAIGSADYQGIYGKSLHALTQEWAETLK